MAKKQAGDINGSIYCDWTRHYGCNIWDRNQVHGKFEHIGQYSQERLYCVTIGREGSGEMDELKVQKEGTGNVCTGTF